MPAQSGFTRRVGPFQHGMHRHRARVHHRRVDQVEKGFLGLVDDGVDEGALLSDGFLATSSEPWLLPDPEDLPEIDVDFTTEANTPEGVGPGWREPDTLAERC